MGTIVRRAIVPTLLVMAGMAALVEGVWFHPMPILVEHETKTSIEIPLLPPPGGSFMGEPPMSGGPPFPGSAPFGGPPTSMKQTVTRIDMVAVIISEPEAIRDVTVGGLVRLDSGEHSGELKRTYSGKGPAVCPT